MRVSLDLEIPITNGVLTVDTWKQAEERAGQIPRLSQSNSPKQAYMNKGQEAAQSLIELLNLIQPGA